MGKKLEQLQSAIILQELDPAGNVVALTNITNKIYQIDSATGELKKDPERKRHFLKTDNKFSVELVDSSDGIATYCLVERDFIREKDADGKPVLKQVGEPIIYKPSPGSSFSIDCYRGISCGEKPREPKIPYGTTIFGKKELEDLKKNTRDFESICINSIANAIEKQNSNALSENHAKADIDFSDVRSLEKSVSGWQKVIGLGAAIGGLISVLKSDTASEEFFQDAKIGTGLLGFATTAVLITHKTAEFAKLDPELTVEDGNKTSHKIDKSEIFENKSSRVGKKLLKIAKKSDTGLLANALIYGSEISTDLEKIALKKNESFNEKEADYIIKKLIEFKKDGKINDTEKSEIMELANKFSISDSGEYAKSATEDNSKVRQTGWNKKITPISK